VGQEGRGLAPQSVSPPLAALLRAALSDPVNTGEVEGLLLTLLKNGSLRFGRVTAMELDGVTYTVEVYGEDAPPRGYRLRVSGRERGPVTLPYPHPRAQGDESPALPAAVYLPAADGLQVFGDAEAATPVLALLDGATLPRRRQPLYAYTSPPGPLGGSAPAEWVQIGAEHARGWAERGACLWLDTSAGRIHGRIYFALRDRPTTWTDTAEAVELARLAPGHTLPVPFGGLLVELTCREGSRFEAVVRRRGGLPFAFEKADGTEGARAMLEHLRFAHLPRRGARPLSPPASGSASPPPSLCSSISSEWQGDPPRPPSPTRRRWAERAASTVRPATPDAFTAVPGALVDAVGFRSRRGPATGEPTLDLALLAALARLHQRSEGRERTLAYGDGSSVSLDAYEFVASEQRLAQTVYEHVLGRRIVTPEPQDDPAFRPVYERVRRALARLERLRVEDRVVLADLGAAVGKSRRRGKRWSVAGGPLDTPTLPVVLPPPFVLARPPLPAAAPEGDTIDVAGHLARLFAIGADAGFTHALTRTAIEGQRGRPADGLRWARKHARTQPDGERHASVGWWRPSELGLSGASVLVPWFVAEFETGPLEEPHAAALRLLDALDALGCPLADVVVTFSGGRSFHARLPCGLFGAPIFRDGHTARRVTAALFDRLTDAPLDRALFDPRHLLRAAGSRYGEGRRCVAFTGAEFGGLPLDLVEQFAVNGSPFDLGDPRGVAPVPALVSLLEEVGRAVGSDVGRGSSAPDAAVVAALLDGVGEGEPFFGDLAGRNAATFRLSLRLLRGEELEPGEAWERVRGWNGRNRPPLSVRDLARPFLSAAGYARCRAEAREAVTGRTPALRR
jgi:hypothetical protein